MDKHPAECAVPSPHIGYTAAAFEMHESLGTRNERCFVADVHGPRARVPTLRRHRYRDRRKARYRLGGLTRSSPDLCVNPHSGQRFGSSVDVQAA